MAGIRPSATRRCGCNAHPTAYLAHQQTRHHHQITTTLGDKGISINRIRQNGHTDTSARVLIATHKITSNPISHALSHSATGALIGNPVAIRIETV